MMRLKRLIQGIEGLEVKGSKEIEISGICAHSKRVAPGNLFIAKKGLTHDGNRFIEDALAAGASCVLTDLYDPFLKVPQLIHPNVRDIEAQIAASYFQHPSQKLKVIGITGTNGKTTLSYLVKYLLDRVGLSAGLIGSIEYIVGDHRFPAERTTPDVITNHKLCKEMLAAECQAAIMEVTSHGLDQNRVGGIDFDICIFTNLTQDHLDYHKTMEEYRRAKEKLFAKLAEEKWAVLNADEDFFPKTKAHVLTYGIEKDADVQATQITLTDTYTQFRICTKNEEILCKSPLIGKFNVYNILAAIATMQCCGISLEKSVYRNNLKNREFDKEVPQNFRQERETIAERQGSSDDENSEEKPTQSKTDFSSCFGIHLLKHFKSVPGRLERVKNSLGLSIFVDFAHAEDALKNVLLTLKQVKKGKLITVFGCGGDRDREKRPKMGGVACAHSDVVIITNDNPRSEDPQEIAHQILQGCPTSYPVFVELDRKKAIAQAIDQAYENDIILIAGKGHEKEQIFTHQIIPFDDMQITRQLCLEKEKKLPCA